MTRTRWFLPASVLVALLAWTVFASTIINPVVIADEVVFMNSALVGPQLASAQAGHVPVQSSGALIYPELLHALGRMHLRLELVAKAVNVLAFVGSTGLLAWRSGRPGSGERSVLVTAAILLAPIGTFTALVMPECLYAGLAILAAVVMVGGSDTEGEATGVGRLAASGAILAVATLTKPHGLVLVVALGLSIAARPILGRRPVPRAAKDLCAAGAGFIIAFVGARAVSTPAGLPHHDLLGPVYRDQLALLLTAARTPLSSLALLTTYLAGVLALLAPTVAVLVAATLRTGATAWEGESGRDRSAAVWVLCALAMLLVLVPPTVNDPGNVHLRYMNFLFPIALAVAVRLTPSLTRPALQTTGRIAGVVWIASAAWLALQLSHVHPLGVAAPELFFLYGGRDFGPFGLRALAVPFLLTGVLGGAAALLSGRVLWPHAQAAVLILFSLVSVPNVWRFDSYLSHAMSSDRAVGKLARARCKQTIASGTPTNFVPLYASIYAARAPIPLLVSDRPAPFASLAPGGACLLTTTAPSEPRTEVLGHSAAVYLLRTPH